MSDEKRLGELARISVYDEHLETTEAALKEAFDIGKRLLRRQTDALNLIIRFGGIEGDHHKAWVLDQVTRLLAGDGYGELVVDACAGKDGPETYSWETGIAP